MNGNLRLVLSDNIVRISFFSSLSLITIQCLLLLISFNKLPPLIPFLNSQPWGVERLYESNAIFSLPLVLTVVLVVNILLSTTFYKGNTLASRILMFNAFLFIFLGFLAYIQIMLLVF